MDVVLDNEGQRATPPAEMLRSGNYIVPTLNGVDYLKKPPLLYWTIALAYKLTGVISPFMARVPTALSGVCLVLSVYLVFRRRAGEMPARWTALGLLASPYLLNHTRWAELDVPLTLCTFLAVVALHKAWQWEKLPPDSTSSSRETCAATGISENAYAFVSVESPHHFSMELSDKSGSWRSMMLLTVGAGVATGAAFLLKGPVPLLFLWAAWTGQMTASGTNPSGVLRQGLWLTAAALSLEFVFLPFSVRFPLALCLLMTGWTVLAWRYAGPGRTRRLFLMLATIAIGLALAAPWAAAVVAAKGWPYVRALIHTETVERTYWASRINSGAPFYSLYYVVALPGMLAPWGLLLPFHFSRSQWNRRPSVYQFSLLTGWLSVAAFSCIAGKEYEYILPALPFLLLPTGYQLSEISEHPRETWVTVWGQWWLSGMTALLPVVTFGGAAFLTGMREHPVLIAEAWLLACVVLYMAASGITRRVQRPTAVMFMALCAILLGLLATRSFHYTGQRSPKQLALTARVLLNRGYALEACQVPPAFAFYAARTVPVQTHEQTVVRKLAGDEPYLYIVQESFMDRIVAGLGGRMPRILMGPYTHRDLLLIGNCTPEEPPTPADKRNTSHDPAPYSRPTDPNAAAT